ncbi:AmpG family muropeptide MFS transporter [Leeia oryzae]|uniref:AmpG family muropeptide MFS transporter n=1 Tax=Leeia oryzae TaxID=356662 RepID=UPI0003742E67|nr:MFS transporter [Leeia oryzae]
MMRRHSLQSVHRYLAILLLGFASGLPLALSGQAMQAWLTVDCVDIATIGFFSLVGLPYTFKFLWAPLMDRFELPFLGRRRGWLVLTQLGLAAVLFWMSGSSPKADTHAFALLALLVAFLSASQDVVIDAYRTDVLEDSERGLGSSFGVFGYRLAMILSGGIALIWADPVQGFGWGWGHVYSVMAAIMVGAAVCSLLLIPSVPAHLTAPTSDARRDLIGFVAVALAVFAGYQLTNRVVAPLSDAVLSPLFSAPVVTVAPVTPAATPAVLPAKVADKPVLATGTAKAGPICIDKKDLPKKDAPKKPDDPKKKWADLLTLLLGVAITVPLAWWVAKLARFETLNTSLGSYFSQQGALAFLGFIILYKLGDAFAGSLTTPFLIKGMNFAQAEVGVVNKVIGIWMTIGGALLGGALMLRLGLYRSLMLFGVLQLVSNFGFYLLAVMGKGAWGTFTLPAFDWVVVSLKEASPVDNLLLGVVAFENITSGMGTAAFVAFLMALCNQRFSATQYALLSAFSAIGRVWVGPMSGVLSESIGWPSFFVFSAVMAVPGLWMLWRMRDSIYTLVRPADAPLED